MRLFKIKILWCWFFLVKLSNGILNRNSHSGAVMIYQNKTWLRVCDTGFNDKAARVVCREMGFNDGRAICCSAYGAVGEKYIQMNNTLRCNGREKNVKECLREERCESASYASVVCFGVEDKISDGKLIWVKCVCGSICTEL